MFANMFRPSTPVSARFTVDGGSRRTSQSRRNSQSSGSRPVSNIGHSFDGNNRLTLVDIDPNAKFRAIVKYLYGRLVISQWLPSTTDSQSPFSGILLRKSRGVYITEPEQIHPTLMAAVQNINVGVAFTMRTETTKVIFDILQPYQTEIILPNGSQIQIVESFAEMASSPAKMVKKFQYAALIREEQILLVWHDEFDRLLNHAADVEGRLLSLVWGTSSALFSSYASHTPIRTPRESVIPSPAESAHHVPIETKPPLSTALNEVDVNVDEESGKRPESLDRPLALTSSVFVGMAMCLIIILILGFGVSNVIYEVLIDGNYIRMALFITSPLFMLMALFFSVVIFTDIFQVIGPINSLKSNTRFFSSIPPDLNRAFAEGFHPPRITIQMPVYNESLENVILPTITSLKAAISHYESRGGTATIFINDDGLAYKTEEEAEARINFYHDNNIGWVARPQNNHEGYVRKGKFKKASNMNFALNVANRVEDEVLRLLSDTLEKSSFVDLAEEEAVYQQALKHVLEADPRARAGGDIRIGEIILIVDSDTRIPVDCLIYGAAEMYFSPEVAIVQQSTGVMQVSGDYFENGITFFTNLIYSAIRFAVGSGETAPFVGHNAFLRWQAVQSVGRDGPDGYVAYWSESHVSEDFDIALRLQITGNTVRLASYHGEEFKEGVSLTIYDELARWEKYAYGCSELVFNPLYKWPWKGPFTRLFLMFLWSNLQLSSKITILGYIFSYYALASGLPLTILNYFLIGWFNGYLDKFYLESWQVFLGLVVVFSAAGNICLAVVRYRLGEKPLLAALWENFRWMPLFVIFFSGLSFHLSMAILAHMFSVNMTWGATAKEKVQSNFFKEMPKIVKSFKYMYALIIPCFGAMIYLGCFAPPGWTITIVSAVVPMAVTLSSHALMPLLLNPSLMVFNY